MGAYVMATLFQTSCVTSGMFITAMAANPLSVNLAAATIGHTITWGEWATAAIVPGVACLLLVPALLYVFYPPEVKDSPEAPAKAREELAKLKAAGQAAQESADKARAELDSKLRVAQVGGCRG